jgi:hypothetical protein
MSVHKCRKQIVFLHVALYELQKAFAWTKPFCSNKKNIMSKTHSPRSCKSVSPKQSQTRDVSHCDLAIYSKKYLNAKEEL